MQRLMVVGRPVTRQAILRRIASRYIPLLPTRLSKGINRLCYLIDRTLKRGGSGMSLRDLGVDLLFCPFTAPTYFEPGIPTVCTVHDLQYKTYPEFFTPADVAHRDSVFVDACRRATMIAAVSDYSRAVAMRHGNLDQDRISTIHHRIARRICSSQNQPNNDVLKRLRLEPGEYLIYPANFWKHKKP